jgi:hypothetical protein
VKLDPKVAEIIKQFSEALAEQYPEIREVLDQVRDGELSEADATAKVVSLVSERNLGRDIEELAFDMFKPLQQTSDIPVLGSQGAPVPIYQGPTGRPQLNPLLAAAIAERLMFDGDVPELRSGMLPEGATAAVPVETTARDPVTIGRMLQTASDEVTDEIRDSQKQYVEKAIESGASVPIVPGKDLPMALTGVSGYEAGQEPELRNVPVPAGGSLGALTLEERQEAAWKAISTTQGRKSALPIIEDLVLRMLLEKGFELDARSPSTAPRGAVTATWTMNIDGPRSTQASFAFVETAARALGAALARKLRESPVVDPVLEVVTVNTLSDRQVGWAARVVSRKDK